MLIIIRMQFLKKEAQFSEQDNPQENSIMIINQGKLNQTAQEQISSKKRQSMGTSRYARYKRLLINPIFSDSQDEQTIDFSTNICLNFPSSRSKQIKKRTKTIQQKKKIGQSIQNSQFLSECGQFQCVSLQDNIPKQCLEINRQYKSQFYNQLKVNILRAIQGKTKNRIIFITGGKQTGKKTIVFDVLASLQTKYNAEFKKYFISCEDNVSALLFKINQLFSLIKHLNMLQQQKINQIQQQALKRHILVINNYTLFISTLKSSSIYHEFKHLIKINPLLIFICLDCRTLKKDIELLEQHNYLQLSAPANNKEYMLKSLISIVNHYQYVNQKWIISKPVANFLCSKLEQNSKLTLNIIKKFVEFLQNESIRPSVSETNQQCQVRQVKRQNLQTFLSCYTNKLSQIDIAKLSIHQKGVIIACYVSLRQCEQVLIPCKDLYRIYCWVCVSLKINQKTLKELESQTLYQLEVYKIIKIYPGKLIKRQKQIMLKIDLDYIKYSFQNQFLLSKFFGNAQVSQNNQ